MSGADFALIRCFRIVKGFSYIQFNQMFSWGRTQARRPSSFQLARRLVGIMRCLMVISCCSFVDPIALVYVDAHGLNIFAECLRGFDVHDVLDLMY